MLDTLIEHAKIVTMDDENRIYPDGYIAIKDGKITYVGTEAPQERAQTVIDGQKAIYDWMKKAAQQYPDIQFIYRAHPAEAEAEFLLKLQKEYPNFFCLSKEPIKHWIMACDKIYNWTSTSAAEVYAAKKQAFILEPVPVDHRVTYPFFEGGQTVTDYDGFKATLDMASSDENQPLDVSRFEECYMQSETPVYKTLCDVLEETFSSTTYHSKTYYPNNTQKDRDAELRYAKFWNSYPNLLLVMLAKKTTWNISLLNNRRNVPVPEVKKNHSRDEYYAGRTKTNATSPEEIRGLIDKFRTIIG